MPIHILFDLLSYAIAGWLSWRVFKPSHKITVPNRLDYYMITIIGFVIGSITLGTLNTYLSLHELILSKSILGALFGAIVAIEIYKHSIGVSGSTGAYFVPSLAIGIAIGRIGCFLSGIEDYTYGTQTTLPWGHDFGDGVMRHPVQLYESGVMFLFFIYSTLVFRYDEERFRKYIFYIFILVYSLQRFAWEFLKPYETILWGLNLFQFVCLALIGYALLYIRRSLHGTLQPSV